MSNTSGQLFSLLVIFVLKELLNRWRGSDFLVRVFVKGHALMGGPQLFSPKMSQ